MRFNKYSSASNVNRIVHRTLTSWRRHFVRTVGTVVNVVAHQVVGDAMRHRLAFELSAIVDWNDNNNKTRFLRGFIDLLVTHSFIGVILQSVRQ